MGPVWEWDAPVRNSVRDVAIVTELLLIVYPDAVGFAKPKGRDTRFVSVAGTVFHYALKAVKMLPPPLRVPAPAELTEVRTIGDAIENVFACSAVYGQNASIREDLYGYLNRWLRWSVNRHACRYPTQLTFSES
jgi:hypothetical protein